MGKVRDLERWWRTNRGWVGWKLRHPRGRYRDYYVERVAARLDDGAVHVSLGGRATEDETFSAAGRAVLDLLVQDGLRPSDRALDYGCGSLRIGRHLIDYLDPDRYTGLDLTERFYTEGLAGMDPALLEKKRPQLAVITPDELARHAASPPDVLISIGVLIHVPRAELGEYLDRVCALVGESTRAYITFFEAPEQQQLSEMTWTWSGDLLVREVEARGRQAEHTPIDWPPAKGTAREARVLRIRGRRASS